MRCLNRNKQIVWYSLFEGDVMNTDSEGNFTGTRSQKYSEPEYEYFNVSAGKGNADVNPFGIDTPYSRTMVTTDIECPVDESTRVWIGVSPEDDKPHNYEVVAVAKSINSVTYALREVSVG